MGNKMGIITATTLCNIQVANFPDGLIAYVVAISDYQMMFVFLMNCFSGGLRYVSVKFPGYGTTLRVLIIHVFPHARFIQQVKADFFMGNVFIFFRPIIPV